MRGTYDKNVNAAYLYLSDEKISQTKVVSDELNFDLDGSGRIRGIEFLNAQSQLSETTLRSFTPNHGNR